MGPVEARLFFATTDIDEALLARYRDLLAPDEAARHARFVFERHRREYLVTRALCRTSLSRFRDVAPAAWSFRTNAFGRPEIDPPCGLTFNLANHPTMAVCAIVETLDLGVDVEPRDRADDILEVAHTVFSDRELAELDELDADARRDRAVSLWTLKEAYIKARGTGLSLPLRKITMHFEKSAPEVRVDASIDDGVHWHFATFDVLDHRIALATSRSVDVRLSRTVPMAVG